MSDRPRAREGHLQRYYAMVRWCDCIHLLVQVVIDLIDNGFQLSLSYTVVTDNCLND